MARTRTNIEIENDYVHVIMERYGVRTKTEALGNGRTRGEAQHDAHCDQQNQRRQQPLVDRPPPFAEQGALGSGNHGEAAPR